MPFEITDVEEKVIDNALKTGEISDSDKVIIDGFIARLSSDSDLPTVDTISKEQMNELTKEIISLLSQYEIKIDTADNGDITFKLPNGDKKTHNINAVITPTSKAIITPTSKAIITPGVKNRPRWRGGKHTQKNGKKTQARGGSGRGIKDGLRKAIILFLVGLVATIVFPLSIKLIYDYYHEQHAPDDISEETTHVETQPVHKPEKNDIYIAINDKTETDPVYKGTYEKGKSYIILTIVPETYTNIYDPDNKHGSMVAAKPFLPDNTDSVMDNMFYKLKDFKFISTKKDFEYIPIEGGSKNRKSRSKTRKQKRRKTKK